MFRTDLTNLGLRLGTTPPATWRDPTEHLLSLLPDAVAAVDPDDGAGLRHRIEGCRAAVASADSPDAILALLDGCIDACRQALAGIGRAQAAQKREAAALVTLVREAVAILGGETQTFAQDLGRSAGRFEELATLEDLVQLKSQLASEVSTLRRIATERQGSWERAFDDFNSRVELLERQLAATRHEATLDPLTRIPNRSAFDAAGREWLTVKRRQFVMACVDVDNLKGINDGHGHGVGDRALMTVGNALKRSVRSDVDVVARIGGDEFAVLAADLPLRQAENRLHALLKAVAEIPIETPSGTPLKLTLSCGLAELAPGDTLESLRERADAALYQAKRQGKNRVVTHVKPTMRELLQS